MRAERPHIEGGLRGDSLLAVLEAGEHRLQIAFMNPGGVSGMPEWDVGSGLGLDHACEVVEIEMALAGVDRLSEEAGWERACPDEGSDRVPDADEVGVITEGKGFNVPLRYDSVAGALFAGREGTPYRGAPGLQQFWVRTSGVSAGHVRFDLFVFFADFGIFVVVVDDDDDDDDDDCIVAALAFPCACSISCWCREITRAESSTNPHKPAWVMA